MNLLDKILRSKYFKTSLRVKVVVAFAAPMLIILAVLSYTHYQQERKEWEESIQMWVTQLGDMALLGMKNAMLRNDQEVVARIIRNYGTNPSIQEIRVVNLGFEVVTSANPDEVGKAFLIGEAGCDECHRYPSGNRPSVIHLRLGENEEILRVVTPIPNELACQECHSKEQPHLGALIIDAPLNIVFESAWKDQVYNFSLAVASLLFVAVFLYLMFDWLLQKRVGVLYEYLTAFAAGNFSVRVPKKWRTEDEITKLADRFNEMADALERHQKEQREIAIVRQEAIAEERERIAYELHDGVAQLLAYLTTKLTALRLYLNKQDFPNVEENLNQMEEMVLKQTLEVRTSIIGLRLVGQGGSGLVKSLRDYVTMCNRVSDLNVIIDIGEGTEALRFEPETELHLLRIVQEAVSNARKHSKATEVRISVSIQKADFLLVIQDDGVGFDPWKNNLWQPPHFGLQTMRARAEKIGALFKIDAEPGQGVQVSIRLNLPEQ